MGLKGHSLTCHPHPWYPARKMELLPSTLTAVLSPTWDQTQTHSSEGSRTLGLNPSVTAANSVTLGKFLVSVFNSEKQTFVVVSIQMSWYVIKHVELCWAYNEPPPAPMPAITWVGAQTPWSPSCSGRPPAVQETEDWDVHKGVSLESPIGPASSWLCSPRLCGRTGYLWEPRHCFL